MKIVYKILIALIVIAVGFGLSLVTYHLFGYDKIMSFWQYILLRSKYKKPKLTKLERNTEQYCEFYFWS